MNRTCTLPNNVSMPSIGLGVFQVPPGDPTRIAVEAALKTGYRLIDTAAFYQNEADVGEALKRSGVSRDEVFLTSKVWLDDQGYERTLRAFDRTLENLGVEVLDLYLIHWPVEDFHQESWRALVDLHKQGRCRAIGVSNYTETHLDQLAQVSDVVPAINQMEFHPFVYRESMLVRCREAGIQLQAYSPLVRAEKFRHPTVVALSKKYNKTPAQILLRWNLDHGVAVIPKTRHIARMRENLDVFDFELDPQSVKDLDALSCDFHVCWNPYE